MIEMTWDVPLTFEWDKGNRNKNEKHDVADNECEEAFFDPAKVTLADPLHSESESRYILIGKTQHDRLLFVAFTLRHKKVRVISARDLNKREYFLYEEQG